MIREWLQRLPGATFVLTACAGAPPPAAEPPAQQKQEARPEARAEGEEEKVDPKAPRVLHLRDERFGIEFDAPDDSWLGTGPRVNGGGAQHVWIWTDGKRQIDVQALDLSIAPGKPPDQATFAKGMAAGFRTKGHRVSVLEATLAGERCHHLVIDMENGWQQDMFILHRGNMNYALLVTQRPRDVGLLDTARNGFKLRAHAP